MTNDMFAVWGHEEYEVRFLSALFRTSKEAIAHMRKNPNRPYIAMYVTKLRFGVNPEGPVLADDMEVE